MTIEVTHDLGLVCLTVFACCFTVAAVLASAVEELRRLVPGLQAWLAASAELRKWEANKLARLAKALLAKEQGEA